MSYYNIDTNAHYFVPMQPTLFSHLRSDDIRPIECEVINVDDDYKITLHAIPTENESYQHTEEFYQCDFISLIKSDIIVKKTSPRQYMRKIKWWEPLSGKTKLVHEGYILDEK